jgi:hypothetical protein
MDISSIAKELGKHGGQTTSDKYGTDHYRKMQALSVKAKKAKKKLQK